MGPRIFVTIALLTCLTVLGIASQCLSTLEDVLQQSQENAVHQQAEAVSDRLHNRLDRLRSEAQKFFSAAAQGQDAAHWPAAAVFAAQKFLDQEPLITRAGFYLVGSQSRIYGRSRTTAVARAMGPLERSRVWLQSPCADAADTLSCDNEDQTRIRVIVPNIASLADPTHKGRTQRPGTQTQVEIALRLVASERDDAGTSQLLGSGNSSIWVLLRADAQVLSSLLEDDGLGASTLFDSSGHRITELPRIGELGFGRTPTRKDVRAFLSSRHEHIVSSSTEDDDSIIVTILSRINNGGDLVYGLSVDPDESYKRLYHLRRELALSGLIFTLAALLMAFELARRIAEPLRKVTEMTRSISQGALNVRVNVRGVDELVSLGSSVNEMAERITHLLAEQRDAGRMASELETARLVHEMMFPPAQVTLPGLSTHAFSRSASECCGDLWGIVPFPDGRTLVFVADASGHGVSSAFMAVAARTAFGIVGWLFDRLGHKEIEAMGPSTVLELLNRAVCEAGHGRVLMTMFLAVIDPKKRQIRYANAGHNFPCLIQRRISNTDKTPLKNLLRSGNILGLSLWAKAETWEEGVESYLPGDKFVLYSDGIIENKNDKGERFGRRRLRGMLRRHAAENGEELCKTFRETFETFTGSQKVDDDCTLVVVELLGVGEGKDSPHAPPIEVLKAG